MTKINLGDEVKDSLSKFQGIVVAVHNYLHGCTRMSVTTRDKEPKTMAFDMPQLVLVVKERAKAGNRKVGGPAKYMDEGRHE